MKAGNSKYSGEAVLLTVEEAKFDLGLVGSTSYDAAVASWLIDAEDIVNSQLGTPFNADVVDYYKVADNYQLSGRNPPVDGLTVKVQTRNGEAAVPAESIFVDNSTRNITLIIDNQPIADDRMEYPVSVSYKDQPDEKGENTAKSMAKFIVQNRFRLQELGQNFDASAELQYVQHMLRSFIKQRL